MKKFNKIILNQFSNAQNLQKTALNNYHKQIGGKMVPFAGYELPVQYKLGIMKEHLHCRESASLFDVSHMGQVKIRGNDRFDFIEKLITGNIRDLKENNGFLSLILNNNAGIIDDTIVSNMGDHIHMVVNGANKEIDRAHMQQVKEQYFKNSDVSIEFEEDRQLVAFQGPKAAQVLQRFTDSDLSQWKFMTHNTIKLNKVNTEVLLCRCGYTGEDGFEISMPYDKTEQIFDLLHQQEEVQAAGLGARDSLRCEAGLCLHGNDMTDQLNPATCSLMWVIRKGGKNTTVQSPFIGRAALTKARKEGINSKRVGFQLEDKGVVRPPCEVYNTNQELIGNISSGLYSPTLQKSIGMCFVDIDYVEPGTDILIKQKNKFYKAKVVKTPLINTNYVK